MREQLQYHLYKRFEILEKIGEGTYGVVFKVIDKRSGEICALKKIFDAFQNKIDSQRTYREVLYLSQVRHENIIRLLDVIPGRNQQDIYLLFEYIDYDIQKILRMCHLAPIQRKYIIRQLLQALHYLHSNAIAHRDIKPSNILIDKNCNIKLCDFGLTRNMSHSLEAPLTNYIASRSYRPPEVILNKGDYGTTVDIWGVGCLLGQMILQQPVFVSQNSSAVLEKILELVQIPKKADLIRYYSDHIQQKLLGLKRHKKTSFYDKFCSATDEEIDLLINLLEFTPERRITAKQALKHSYFQQLDPCRHDTLFEVNVKDQDLEETSCRKAIQLISNRFRKSEKSTISLSGPFSQKYMDFTSSKLSYKQQTDKPKSSKSKSKKLNKSKSTIIMAKNVSRITQSRENSYKKRSSKHKKSNSKTKIGPPSVISVKTSSIMKPSLIKKRMSSEIDKKKFYSQKILKGNLLQFLGK